MEILARWFETSTVSVNPKMCLVDWLALTWLNVSLPSALYFSGRNTNHAIVNNFRLVNEEQAISRANGYQGTNYNGI